MKTRLLKLAIFAVFSLLSFASCTKHVSNNENNNREQPAHPGGITLDTTWHNNTIIPF